MTATALSCSQRISSPGHWTVLWHLNIPIGSDSRLKYPDLTSHAQKYQKFKRPGFHSRNFEHIRTWDMEGLLIWRDTTLLVGNQRVKQKKYFSEKNSFRQAHMYDMNCNCDGISQSLFAQTTTISKIRLLEQNSAAGLSPLHSSYPW